MREVSLPFLQAAFAQETGEAPIVLVTITHDDLTAPIRVANYDVDVVSNEETFIAYPFELTLPTEPEAGASRATVTIDNVHRDIVEAVRNCAGTAPQVTLAVVLASSPDTIEASFPGFDLRNVSYDALTIEGELTLDSLAGERYPAGRFRPGAFPGLF